MQITKQHFAVLISLLFAVSLSADPIIHSLETEDHHEIIECQVCESESFKSYDYFLLVSYASTLKAFANSFAFQSLLSSFFVKTA